MTSASNVRILVNPKITPDQLFSFYVENNVCEQGFGKKVAAKILSHSDLIVAAFKGDRLVGIATAVFDGLSADIMEFCLELEYQGRGLKEKNGSIIERDAFGIGKKMGNILVKQLVKMGATFIEASTVEGREERFYKSIGLAHNVGVLSYYLDRRPYILNRTRLGASRRGSATTSKLIVCATIVRERRVLLVKHSDQKKPDYGDWILPGGKVEPRESLEKALRREIVEEAGLEIKIVKKLAEHTDPYTGGKLLNFLCVPLTSRIKLSPELARAAWYDLDGVEKLRSIHLGLRRFLVDVLRRNASGDARPQTLCKRER